LNELRLEPLEGCELASLEPWSKIGVPSLMAGALRIRRLGEPTAELVHSPDALVVLAFDERDGWYREVNRAQLLESCLVIAHEDRAALVEGFLKLHARPGFRRFDQKRLEGLPCGWVAFLDVTIVAPADEERHQRLAPLCAAPANAIAFQGGLRLGANVWHVDLPPEALVTLEKDAALTLSAECRRKLSSDAHDISLGTHVSPAATCLTGRGFEAGDYDVKATDARSSVLAHGGLRLRCANYPRPAAEERLARIGYVLEKPFSLISAVERSAANACMVTGGLLVGKPSQFPAPQLGLPKHPLTTAMERVSTRDGHSSRPDNSLHLQSCSTRGVHYWICDPGFMGETTRTLKRMRCRDCQREVWTVNRGRVQRGRRVRSVAIPARAAPPKMEPSQGCTPGIRPAQDVLLDALTYVGRGSWDNLKQLAKCLGDDPLLAWQTARTLFALGHIELTLDERTFRMKGWQIAPASLVQVSDGSWVLAGARSDELIDQLDTLVGVQFEEQEAAPTVLRAPSMSGQDASQLASKLRSPFGGEVLASPNFAARVAAALLPLADLRSCLEQVTLPSRGYEVFNLRSGQWMPGSAGFAAGAYRIDLHGRLYGIASVEDAQRGVMRVVDVLTAKYLAAAAKRTSLIGYDHTTHSIAAIMGAELPGVLHRVATMCSGQAPRRFKEAGVVVYERVSEEVAAHIQRALSL
jgi:hypothetical protein